MFKERELPIGIRKSLPTQDIEPTDAYAGDPMPSLNYSQEAELIDPKEKPYFVACAIVSIFFYVCTLFLLPYWIACAGLLLVSHGLILGHIRGNSVRVSAHQFPEIHQATEQLCQQIGLHEVPPVYIMESGGMLNAFATRFLAKDYVVLYSNVVEMAYEQGEDALKFVLAHELAHIHRGHLRHRWWIGPALLIPFLGKAYYRACEYTCDLIAAHAVPQGAKGGLLSLSAGKQLHQRVNAESYAAQTYTEDGFWVWLAEITSTHPRLPKRLAAVMELPIVKQHQLKQDYLSQESSATHTHMALQN